MRVFRLFPIVALTGSLLLAACGQQPAASSPVTAPAAVSVAPATASKADLSGIKTYLTGKTTELKHATAALAQVSDRYYAQAQAANFDYAALAKNPDALKTVMDARAAWIVASPLYEQMEGIVAGTPALAQYDVDIDAGSSKAQGGDNVVSVDVTLPDGKLLEKPGNLFGVTESTLWGRSQPTPAASRPMWTATARMTTAT